MVALASAQAFLIGLVLLVAGGSKFAGGFGRIQAGRTALGILVRSDPRAVLAWRLVGMTEVAVGLTVLVRPSLWAPSAVAAALLAGGALYSGWAMRHAPAHPCGCFGGGSSGPVSVQTVARASMLAVLAALAAASGGGWTYALSLGWPGGVLALEAALLFWLSPEARSLPDQLRRRARPACLFADVPLETTLSVLKRSSPWTRLRPCLTSEELLDHWRDGCWHFLSYPATIGDTQASAIFAVRVPRGKAPTRGALVEQGTRRVLVQLGEFQEQRERAPI
jgi:hypothetical protein